MAAAAAIIVAGIIAYTAIVGTNQTINTQKAEDNEVTQESDDSQIDKDEVEVEYPFFITTMTHMEGNWDFTIDSEDRFLDQIDKLEFAMDIADEYDATLTIETEEPFARANAKWDYNFMAEIFERGHGVGSHCDRGGSGNGTYDELVEELKLIKSLVDDLVGEKNNLGCSGAGSSIDWAQALVEAGFKYVDGLVGFHMLAFPLSERPDGWDDLAIYNEFYHDNVPVEMEDRIHPLRLENTLDWDEDDTGIVVSSGQLGRLSFFSEGDRTECMESGCDLEADDVDKTVAQVIEAVELHDTSRIGKLTFYIPTSEMIEENEVVLRYFFSEMQKLEEAGMVEWASQVEVYEAFVDWEKAQ